MSEEEMKTRLHGKLIAEILHTKKKYVHEHTKTSDCPVCDETMESFIIVPVDLVGNVRNTWIHNTCTTQLSTCTERQMEAEIGKLAEEEEETQEQEKAAIGMFQGSQSFDAVVAEIAKEAAIKATHEAVRNMGPIKIELQHPNGVVQAVDEHTHAAFGATAKFLSRRQPVFLTGPTGTGKSYLARQVAKHLTRIDSDEPLPYYETPCSSGITEGHLLGRLLPTGAGGQFEYTHAILSRAYEEGGVCCLEEIDSSDPNTLLCVNNALESDQMTLPNRIKDWYASRHPDFVLVIIGNTTGQGADRVYCGRNQLDGAFLDRFMLRMIEVGYDKLLEGKLCPDTELLALLHTWRERTDEAKLRRWISTRTIMRCYEDSQFGDSLEEITDSFFVGWPDDERQIVQYGKAADGEED